MASVGVVNAKRLIVMLLAAVGGFFSAALIYIALTKSVDWVWHDKGDGSLWGEAGPPIWFAILIPVLAGGVVYLLQTRGALSPGPLEGLALEMISPRHYLWFLGAIVATMLGGLALGPENAVLVTAGFVSALAGSRLTGNQDRIVRWTGFWALAGLFCGAYLLGGISVADGAEFSAQAVLVGLVAAALTAMILLVVRWAAVKILGISGGQPLLWLIVTGGAIAGGIAVVYHLITGETVSLALTSGEQMVGELLALGSLGAIALATLAKSLVYIITLSTGFRGGEYFPAIFIGAGSGGIAADLLGGSLLVGAVAGISAGVAYLAHPPWWAAVILGLALGFLFSGWAAVPISIAAALIGSVVPRIDPPQQDKLAATQTSPPASG